MSTSLPVPSDEARASSLTRLQDRLGALLECGPTAREPLVASMMRRDARESTSYWFQLIVAVGIATLGLVLGSTAVVIGAMLVAPLMGPIVHLGMGLATGSPYLVLRSGFRVAMSVAFATCSSAVLTLLLPFHELNAEILARTSPTALDLLTAGFCALAGVYSALRPASETATTAAGTSIGISLVPPLCASGYGLGTSAWPVAGGAAMLFLTNMVAIVLVATVAFIAVGFNRVDVAQLERAEFLRSEGSQGRITWAISRRLEQLFEARWGHWLRVLMPFMLLAIVYVPLRQALDEVAWQIRVRNAVQGTVEGLPQRVVESRVRVGRREVDVLVILLGKNADAEAARARLDGQIRQISGVTPRVDVLAVADASALAGIESLLYKPPPLPPPAPPSPAKTLDSSRAFVRKALERAWPARSAGAPLAIDIGSSGDTLGLRVIHLGQGLDAPGREALERSLTEELGQPVSLSSVALPTAELTREEGDVRFIAELAPALRASAELARVSVCAEQPPAATGRRRAEEETFASAIHGLLAEHPRVTLRPGTEWRVRFSLAPCPPADESAPVKAATPAPP
ncbi:DUF389 domain-containing protein [Hyalangium gracile]|uniref:DUF389 domain-containing protein n=1 Tax=Hyalangium gracile TaxID=394092 RepID=UPI001CCFEB9E|nr:DUF389 domain-containing protein [Hyalangium gracile]